MLQRTDLHQLRALVPHDVEIGGLGQEALEELDGDERMVVDDHRRGRHLDEVVAHDAEAAVGTEGGDVVVDGDAIAVRVRRHASAERRDHIIGGEVRLAVLMRDRDLPVAALRAKSRLHRRLRRRLSKDDRGGGEKCEGGEENESLH